MPDRRPRRRARGVPPQRRVLAQHNCRSLTARFRPEQATPPPGEPCQPGRLADTLWTTMFEQPIDTRFPGQQFPVGRVVTFLDRHRRTVFGTVTELRRHEAIGADGETSRRRVRYARLRLIEAGPTGGATMQQVELSVSFCCEICLRCRSLARPRGREALSAHPPTPVDDTPRGSLEQRRRTRRCPLPGTSVGVDDGAQ